MENPVENPSLLIAFENRESPGRVPFHSIDRLDIIQGNKHWFVARSNWRRKVRALFRSKGISFPENEGHDIE